MYRNAARHAADPSQFYETERRDALDIGRYLREQYPAAVRVFEPCYGHGALARVLEEECGFAIAVARDKYTLPVSRDFLTDRLPEPDSYDLTITNTPFAKKLHFFQRLQQTNKVWAAIFPFDIIPRLRNSQPTTHITALIPKQNMVFTRGGQRQQIGVQCVWLVSDPAKIPGISVVFL